MNIRTGLDMLDEDDLERLRADYPSLTFVENAGEVEITGDEDVVLQLLRWAYNDDLEAIFSVAIRAERVTE